jgi:hypothetical protein
MDLAVDPIAYYWPSQPSYCSELRGPFAHDDEMNTNISLNSETDSFQMTTFEEIQVERGELAELLEASDLLTEEYELNTMRSFHSLGEECEDGMLMIHSQGNPEGSELVEVFWFDDATEDGQNGQINFTEDDPTKKAKPDPEGRKGKSFSRWQQPERNSQQKETNQMAETAADASRSILVDPFTSGTLTDGEEISDEESRNLVLKINEILDYDVQEPNVDSITADELIRQVDRWLAERGLLKQKCLI